VKHLFNNFVIEVPPHLQQTIRLEGKPGHLAVHWYLHYEAEMEQGSLSIYNGSDRKEIVRISPNGIEATGDVSVLFTGGDAYEIAHKDMRFYYNMTLGSLQFEQVYEEE